MPLNFVITDAGRAAIAQVGGAIGPVTLTKIAIGSAGYTPTASRTALQTEIKRLNPSGSSVPVPGTIHLTAQDDSADSYSVKEIGLYTNNNVLFAVYSQTGVILTKGSTASALFAMDFVLTNVPAGTVVVGDAGFSYAQANETRLGVLAIATTVEAQAGTIDTKIITPLKLAQVTATESRRGLIELATTTEAQSLTLDATKALTVARLVDRTATTGRAGVVVLASSNDTQTGTDTGKAVTPAGLASRTATDARAGIVELADNTETQTGTSTALAVTPAGLASRTATETRAGIIQIATQDELLDATSTTKAITPKRLSDALSGVVHIDRVATTSIQGIVELATNAETQTGTDTDRAVTPAGLASAAVLFAPPGAVMPFARTSAPSGWLPANGNTIGSAASGAVYDSQNYDELFAVLWGSWSNTLLPIQTSTGAVSTRGASAAADFAANKRLPLPDMRGYFVRGSGKNADDTDAGAFGAKQADDFKKHTHEIDPPQTNTSSNGSHTHTVNKGGTGGGNSVQNGPSTGANDNITTGSNGAHTHTLDISKFDSSETGGTETRPKNIALLYCIKF